MLVPPPLVWTRLVWTLPACALLVCALLFGAASSRAFAQESDPSHAAAKEAATAKRAQEVLDRLALKQQSLQTMTADFRQEVTTPLTLRPIVSKGKLSFRREPACACFTITEPRPSIVRFDADSYQVYRPREKRAERFLLEDGDLAAALVQVLAPRTTELQKSFRATATEVDGNVVVELHPTAAEMQRYFTRLSLTVDDKKTELRAIGYRNKDGDTVEITLSDVQLDPQLDATTFSAALPEGTEVLVHQLKKS
ncbi:MAG: outer membrane lipoprotein carrier protein LolA [Planctomycetota bacterium]